MPDDSNYIWAKCSIEAENPSEEKLRAFRKQLKRDALCGTFDTYSDKYLATVSDETDHIKKHIEDTVKLKEEADEDRTILKIGLDKGIFSDTRYGLQHLVGVFSSDLFSRASSMYKEAKIKVKSIDLNGLERSYVEEYRQGFKRVWHADSIKNAFCPNGGPFLAFSLKPRTGTSINFIRKTAKGVLEAGFNLVELDTRDIRPNNLSELLDISKECAEVGLNSDRVTRFSINISLPPALACEHALEIYKAHEEVVGKDSPWVLKVDGGLDGLSAIQSIKRIFKEKGLTPPVITCYPLINKSLANAIGAETLREFLVISGADIIYPGGCPRIGEGRFIGHESAKKGYDKYCEIIDGKREMPSIAGGIHAGQIPAYYAMFGERIAYFLGGGVALHKEGAVAGAKLCCELIDYLSNSWPRNYPEFEFQRNIGDMYHVDRDLMGEKEVDLVDTKALLNSAGIRPFWSTNA